VVVGPIPIPPSTELNANNNQFISADQPGPIPIPPSTELNANNNQFISADQP